MNKLVAANVRRELEKHFGGRIPDEIWDYLVSERYVAEAIDMDDGKIDGLIEPVEKLYRVRGEQPPNSQGGIRSAQDLFALDCPRGLHKQRAYVISEIYADKARRDPRVKEFRRRRLNGRLLKLEEIETWVDRKYESERPATNYLLVSLDGRAFSSDLAGNVTVDPPISTLSPEQAPRLERRLLHFYRLSSGRICAVATRAGGALDALAKLSSELANRYGCTEAQASAFVLTDITPIIESIKVQYTIRNPDLVLSRITITADPTASPPEVAKAFRQTRDQILGRRPRTLSKKHLNLALFCSRRPPERWPDRMQAWNEKYPTWRYKAANLFKRDAKQALKRLLGPNAKYDDEAAPHDPEA